MALIHGFIFAEPFYDDVNFPRGFGRSGDFNIAEAAILTSLGRRLFKLEQGLCKPENQVEEQFVQMCKLQFEGQTKIELLWRKYKKITQHKTFHSLHGIV
jgi:uncharacterized protein YifE (UPF0438 family)